VPASAAPWAPGLTPDIAQTLVDFADNLCASATYGMEILSSLSSSQPAPEGDPGSLAEQDAVVQTAQESHQLALTAAKGLRAILQQLQNQAPASREAACEHIDGHTQRMRGFAATRRSSARRALTAAES